MRHRRQELLNRLTQFRQRITTVVEPHVPDGRSAGTTRPEEKDSIAAIAARSNHTPDEVAYDYLAGGAERFLFYPIVGYNEDNLDIIHTMLSDETTTAWVVGWRGALLSSIVDASVPSWMLIHWARDLQPRAEAASGAAGEAADP